MWHGKVVKQLLAESVWVRPITFRIVASANFNLARRIPWPASPIRNLRRPRLVGFAPLNRPETALRIFCVSTLSDGAAPCLKAIPARKSNDDTAMIWPETDFGRKRTT